MKKLFAVLLALAMLLGCAAAFADDADVVGAPADLVAAAQAIRDIEHRPWVGQLDPHHGNKPERQAHDQPQQGADHVKEPFQKQIAVSHSSQSRRKTVWNASA